MMGKIFSEKDLFGLLHDNEFVNTDEITRQCLNHYTTDSDEHQLIRTLVTALAIRDDNIDRFGEAEYDRGYSDGHDDGVKEGRNEYLNDHDVLDKIQEIITKNELMGYDDLNYMMCKLKEKLGV